MLPKAEESTRAGGIYPNLLDAHHFLQPRFVLLQSFRGHSCQIFCIYVIAL
jgi:hypothetical protein